MPKRLWLPSIFALLFSLAHAAASERAHLFSGRSCGGCERIEKALNAAAIPYRYYNIDEIENYKILVGYEDALGVTAQELPALVAGGRLFAGTENILRAVGEIRQALAGGTGVSLEVAASSGEEIERRFRSIDILSLCLAGLGDGINPCAFATIAFLVGCLAAAGRRKALYVGLSFTAGVFITYFAVGLGFFRALFMLREFMALREYFHYGALGLLLMGAVLALLDALWIRLRNGKPLFHMPEALRRRANMQMARGMHGGRWILSGFLMGCVVSLLELACTGQVYLPTILYMLETGASGGRAYLYLLLYNICFILPLLIMLALCLRGLGSQRLWDILQRHAALARLVAGGVFLLMFLSLWIR